MKRSAILCASVAVFAFSLMPAGAVPPGEASAKMSNFFRLSPNDPAAEKACSDKGGTVSTDQDGYKICTMPRVCAAPGGATRTDKLNTGDPAAAKKCKDACGTVSTDQSGAQVCTKPAG
jgi:hypothetical protein